ncbi:adhesin-like protein [Methanobrevibacter ruminantium M1]|uniref:Adhesin-like protein n=2 Tax=Methanobrevibacter ruminantium TaxID=83816 RepID=D3E3Q1_METRM|nr:adhesin-like protein [Methanobrevibacter ruminantium M1]
MEVEGDKMNFKEFEELINSGVKEISLNEDISLEDKTQAPIEIKTDGLVIDGKNHIIDGNNKLPILYIKASNITLKNIIFKNGFSEDYSGAITNYSNDLKVEHCQFIDNSTENAGDLYGGAIYNGENSKLTVEKSIFKENDSDFGGAIFIDSDSTVKINNSVFELNISEFDGGAIYNKGELIIDKSIFNQNMAFKGGAIFNENSLTINDSHFKNNKASDGNDIQTENEDISISNSLCEFINNDNY